MERREEDAEALSGFLRFAAGIVVEALRSTPRPSWLVVGGSVLFESGCGEGCNGTLFLSGDAVGLEAESGTSEVGSRVLAAAGDPRGELAPKPNVFLRGDRGAVTS